MGRTGGWRALLAAGVVALGCNPSTAPAPVGEVLLSVDTDAPVPTLASRLRVDLYDASGTWFASRDFGLPDPADWPTSFAVSAPDGGGSATVTVRVRAYPEGQVRDYLGEVFQDRPDPSAGLPGDIISPPAPPAGATPRLLDGTQDVTPATEPQPLVAIDRLLRVTVVPGTVQGASLVLRGACLGTMANMAADETCVDTEATRVPDADLALSTPPPTAAASVAGTFGASACTATPRAGSTANGGPLHDAEVCVPGGAFVFGEATTPTILQDPNSSAPPRVALIPSLLVDTYEVTVARYRAAVQAGFTPPTAPLSNDAPLPSTTTSFNLETGSAFCTYSDSPMSRETMPLTCVPWATARAFCQYLGGDLPTEAEWEYVAAQSARVSKTRYAWGDDPPTCTLAVYARGLDAASPAHDVCTSLGFGPQPGGVSRDVSTGLGVLDLAGSMSEWTLDAPESLASRCWLSAPLESPSCQLAGPALAAYSIRGGAWLTPFLAPVNLLATTRSQGIAVGHAGIGFRCVRDGGGS